VECQHVEGNNLVGVTGVNDDRQTASVETMTQDTRRQPILDVERRKANVGMNVLKKLRFQET